MTKLLVIGASRGIGLETVKRALWRGHSVRAFARNSDAITLEDEHLERVSGDARKADDLASALSGVDAVVLALGIGLRQTSACQSVSLFSEATAALLPQMEAQGVRRLLAVTGAGAGESRRVIRGPYRIPFALALAPAYRDKGRQEEMIEASDLDWTLVRPGILTNTRRIGVYRVMREPEDWRLGLVARADVADFLVREIEEPRNIHGAPVLAY